MSFWRDKWCGKKALSHSFPLLFALAANKEATLAECGMIMGLRGF